MENAASVKSIRWSTGETAKAITFSPVQNMPVTVRVTDNNGCIIYDTAFTQVKACNSAENCIAVPSAFTPNNDGANDAIGPISNGCHVSNVVFQIYNRWGQMVFETNEMGKKWDRKINNIVQPQGTYVFICSFISNDNKPYLLKGTLQLQ